MYTDLLGHKLLSKSEEQMLLNKAQNGCEQSRERLILLNMRLVNWVCEKHATETVSAEDLIGDGVQGLMRAIEKMDMTRAGRLSTYATYWIHAFVGRSPLLQSTLRLPDYQVIALGKVRRAMAALYQQGNAEPSHEEIAAQIDDETLTPLAVSELLRLMETTLSVVSLDAPVHGENDEDALSFEEILGTDGSQEEQLINEMDLEFFLSKLPPHEAFVLTRSYGIPRKMKNYEIAEKIGCHPNDVPGFRRRALAKCQRLATYLKSHPLLIGTENWASIMADPVEAPQIEMIFTFD